jgi:broad specificity phosphatase PhoE
LARLLLVRHGVTEFNTSGRFLGHTDAGMTEEGLKQAERLRDRLAKEHFDAIYSSDLRRTMTTAEIICSGHSGEIVVCPELREINYGQTESLTFGEIKSRFPELAQAIHNFSPEMSFPGGETLQEFISRTLKFLDRLDLKSPQPKILIVSHGGPIRTLLCELLGVGQGFWRTFRLDNASLSIVDTYPERAILSLLNDTSHLNEPPSRGE